MNLVLILREKRTGKVLIEEVGHYTFILDYVSQFTSQRDGFDVVRKLFSGSTNYIINMEHNSHPSMNYEILKY